MTQVTLATNPRSQRELFLVLLLSADMAFVVVHLFRDLLPFNSGGLLSLETDRGYAEIFQYVKIYWIVMMFAALWWRARDAVYSAWMLLFAYMLADDSIGFHEHFGHVVAKNLHLVNALGLRGQDLGELVVSASFGVAILLLILLTYRRSTGVARDASKHLACYFGAIVFFGVLVDMLHIISAGGQFEEILGTVEDGGEMLAVSVVCWYVMNLLECRGIRPASLGEVAIAASASIRSRFGILRRR